MRTAQFYSLQARIPERFVHAGGFQFVRICGAHNMKFIRFLGTALAAVLFAAPILHAQEFSKYRDFSLGTNLATVLKGTQKKLTDVNTTYGAPSLFQELTWWPPSLPGPSSHSDSVEQVFFY